LSAERRDTLLGDRRRRGFTLKEAPMWRIRLTRELPRYLLSAAAAFGLLASARFALAPPRPPGPAYGWRVPRSADRAAEAYAVLFARRYLTWDAARPQASAESLEQFLGSGLEAGAGVVLPVGGEQRVEWAEVVQARETSPGDHVYTVGAETDTAGVLYLTVDVARAAGGQLELIGYPAFVGAPSTMPGVARHVAGEISEPALEIVVTRALRNYLAGAAGELAADLSPEARVASPSLPLTLESLQHLEWVAQGNTVLASVQAHDGRGVHYELAYEVEVVRQQGRWEVSAVQTDPNS
jgi:hypothetical protein